MSSSSTQEWEESFVEPVDETFWHLPTTEHSTWLSHTLGRRVRGSIGINTSPTGKLTSSGDPIFCTTMPLSIYSQEGLPIVIIPAGVDWDGASIPAIGIIRRIVGQPMGVFALAALVHDWLYQSRYISRPQADRMFLALMEDLGIEGWRRKVMWAAVRLAGRSAWSSDERPRAKELMRYYWGCNAAEASRRLALMAGWAEPYLEAA
jgi:hypothetical protein